MEVENTAKRNDVQRFTEDSAKDVKKNEEKNVENVKETSSNRMSTEDVEEKLSDREAHKSYTQSTFCGQTSQKNLTLNANTDEKDIDGEPSQHLSSLDSKDYDKESKTDLIKEKVEQASNSHISQPAALAFTIDFGDNKEVDTVKYQNLFERYNARHRRNLSTSKVEVSGKKGSALLSPNLVQKQKIPSTHSEGYFSSEDDTKRKTDSLTEKLKQLGNFSSVLK